MANETNMATQEYWDQAYEGAHTFGETTNPALRRWIENHVPRNDRGSALEIGCYPGGFLAVLGELGYEVNGIDLTAGVDDMAAWMTTQGFRTGTISRGDFFEFAPEHKFDVVMSLGFVEHFTNWQEVLDRHAQLVAPGGLLVVQAPNFVGRFQNWIHRTFDAENLSHHHLPAMDPTGWASHLREGGFEIVTEGFFGPLFFWIEPAERTGAERLGLLSLRAACKLLRPFIHEGNPSYAPYCGVVARRRA